MHNEPDGGVYCFAGRLWNRSICHLFREKRVTEVGGERQAGGSTDDLADSLAHHLERYTPRR